MERKHTAERTILLVEDEALIAMDEADTLSRYGFRVVQAFSGSEAVEIAIATPEIDLILMDIDLGDGMDGTQAAGLILEKRPVPVLFLSSHTEPEIVDRTETITSFGYVVKNSGETVLIASIKMAFRLHDAYLREQTKTEELEALNEEMNATLEEFESTNIELQRKISELEETKKELEHNLAERRRAQKALNESQAEIMSLFEATPAGIGMLRQRQFRKVNSVMCRITGYSEEELLGNLTRMLYFNDGDYDRVGRDFYDAIKKDGFGLTEVNLRHKDGSTINAMIGGSPVDPADVTKGVATVVFDVTRLKQTEEALRKSESEFRSLFNASPAGAVMIVDRVIMKANREMCRITGYTEVELLGIKTRIFYRTDEEYEKVGRELYGPMEATGLGMVEAVIYSREGNPVDVLICASPLDAADPSRGVAVTLLDITARKRMERELGQALEEKSRLMVEMQHRMKNSLAMIAGLINLEMNRSDNPAVRGVLEAMSGRIRSLSSLNALLAGSDDITQIDLDQYLRSIISNLSDIFAGHENTIAIEHRLSPATVCARNASAWGLIANELLTNAFKHAFPAGRSGLLVIELRQYDNDIEFSVRDDGIGAPTDFDLDNPSGLGITMVKMLAEQLGGYLRHTTNGGNTFAVRVPREQ